jgi:TolA-binding protein
MSAHGFRVTAQWACLLGLGFVAGCQSVPPAPSQGRAQPAAESDTTGHGYDGWLFKKATGREQQASPASYSEEKPAGSEIRVPGDPLAPGGVAAGAGIPAAAPATHVVAANAPLKGQDSPKDDDSGGFSLEALAPSNVYKKLKNAAGYGPNEEIARNAYREGIDLFQQQKYAEAAKKFATAADRWPDTALEEDAFFMLAESYFFSDQYPQAHETYEQLLKKHEYSRYLDKAVNREFAIGRYWDQYDQAESHWPVTPNFTDKRRPWFDTWGSSLKAYEHVRLNDPTGPLADDSLMAAGTANFVRGRYEEAAYNYDTLRKEYPRSEHQLQAHLYGLESKQHVYQGEFYDGTALKEAGEIADQALLRFGNTLGNERDKVVEAKNRIVELQSLRDWEVGQYYDQKGWYCSARIYYRSVVDNYPQTRTAELARQRMDEIKGLPGEPPNHFKWLEWVFGAKKKY